MNDMDTNSPEWVDRCIAVIRQANEVREHGLDWPGFFALLDAAEFFSVAACPEEEALFGDFIHERAPKRILELGTGNGRFSNIIIRAMPDDAQFATLDHNPGSQDTYERLKRLERGTQEIFGFCGDSACPGTLDVVKTVMGDDPVDMIFVDTDHTVETTRREVELWLPYVREGGILAFHDIYTSADGVQIVWRELQERFTENYEFTGAQPPFCGIGAAIIRRDQ